jgi:hypothetical protein
LLELSSYTEKISTPILKRRFKDRASHGIVVGVSDPGSSPTTVIILLPSSHPVILKIKSKIVASNMLENFMDYPP